MKYPGIIFLCLLRKNIKDIAFIEIKIQEPFVIANGFFMLENNLHFTVSIYYILLKHRSHFF
jgi:hypothetical protein